MFVNGTTPIPKRITCDGEEIEVSKLTEAKAGINGYVQRFVVNERGIVMRNGTGTGDPKGWFLLERKVGLVEFHDGWLFTERGPIPTG